VRSGGGGDRLVFACVAAGCVALMCAEAELSPLEDRGFFLSLMLAPEGASMDIRRPYVRESSESTPTCPSSAPTSRGAPD
jgi:hypothetical protein